ncbi:hypothetical protein PGT21_033131 [Puccinia graminis f. sp. tritici]|uniref:Uncharacterized protein n=1 Tax=Puccinia graminis f. sp. tritici TaxID=56615 RepID=A0A5B0MQC9_PUCGR|nr:hypothetical protein PGT21_033131 [Puccinia graminis f. sp. tritici]
MRLSGCGNPCTPFSVSEAFHKPFTALDYILAYLHRPGSASPFDYPLSNYCRELDLCPNVFVSDIRLDARNPPSQLCTSSSRPGIHFLSSSQPPLDHPPSYQPLDRSSSMNWPRCHPHEPDSIYIWWN